MKVSLINYTQNARELLIFSKKTRLSMGVLGFEKILLMDEAEKEKEVGYVFGTIGSSWEFVDYAFLIEEVTRAFTHQLVRHRVGVSFAQQSQRSVNMSDGFEFLASGKCKDLPAYSEGMARALDAYRKCIEDGAEVQDARGLLPTNILTSILMKINLRSLSTMMNTRLCYRAQGEFQEVAQEMKNRVLEVHPWADPVLQVGCVQNLSCPFTNFTMCPVKAYGYLPQDTKGLKESVKKAWEEQMTSIQPKI